MALGLGNRAGGGEGRGVGGGGGWQSRSGTDGSKTITRRYPGRGSVYYSIAISIIDGAFKQAKGRKQNYIKYKQIYKWREEGFERVVGDV